MIAQAASKTDSEEIFLTKPKVSLVTMAINITALKDPVTGEPAGITIIYAGLTNGIEFGRINLATDMFTAFPYTQDEFHRLTKPLDEAMKI
jgi:hypothetical protein